MLCLWKSPQGHKCEDVCVCAHVWSVTNPNQEFEKKLIKKLRAHEKYQVAKKKIFFSCRNYHNLLNFSITFTSISVSFRIAKLEINKL